MFERNFILFSNQIEKSLKVCLFIMFSCLLLSQLILLSNEDTQAMVNKAVRYEGVFHEDPIEAKATLQRR